MNRYQTQLAGLSYPFNLLAVIIHILAVFTIVFSQLHFCENYQGLMLWIGFPCLIVSLGLIVLFKGYYLLVQYARLSAGFLLLIISLIHITALQDFGMFLRSHTTGANNPFHFLNGNNSLAGILAVIEFVAAMALIIGAWIRPVCILLILLFTFYSLLFFNLNLFGGNETKVATYSFGLDDYLLHELNSKAAFTFCAFLTIICLVGALFGYKIRSNSVKLNWIVIPVYTILATGLAILFHWYPLIFIIPLSILFCLITYRSGGRIFGNHFGSLIFALLIALVLVFFQNPLGLARKNTPLIQANKKITENR